MSDPDDDATDASTGPEKGDRDDGGNYVAPDPATDTDDPGDADPETIEEERQERLDPENRPEGVEVDNTHRTFDPEVGQFEDTEGEPSPLGPFKTEE